jgi:hypothetical protein
MNQPVLSAQEQKHILLTQASERKKEKRSAELSLPASEDVSFG